MAQDSIVRRQGHNTLPNFVGLSYFPRNDDPENRTFYCASILLLLKPWPNVEGDLKAPPQSWESAFGEFVKLCPARIHIISSIQFFHRCESSAEESAVDDAENVAFHAQDDDGEITAEEESPSTLPGNRVVITEKEKSNLLSSQIPLREELHGLSAVEAAKYANVFPTEESSSHATTEEGTFSPRYRERCTQSSENPDVVPVAPPREEEEAEVTLLENLLTADSSGNVQCGESDGENCEVALPSAVDPSMLNEDQLRAYEIAMWHLDQVLCGRDPPPLRMLIHEKELPGNPKSFKPLPTISPVEHLLVKAAYRGVAASLIGGKTTHSIAMITRGDNRTLKQESKEKPQRFWKHVQYLIIDEMSMLSKSFLAKLSRNITIGKATEAHRVTIPVLTRSEGST
ncbi:hypothetical protein EDD15DRAFT_2380050 [Pisolithus albus]|nr:hypothetical protein EDD15DRAFT_2380050 [Pisolithus albus]